MADAEKVVTADQGGRINLGKSRAGCSFRAVEQGSQPILEPVETVHVPAAEAWLFRNQEALSSVRRDAAHALATSFPAEDAIEDDPLA
jgi:hypothetical protein